jgi:predicted AlkP superfamily pyrophosphatase or phosphodiesterase
MSSPVVSPPMSGEDNPVGLAPVSKAAVFLVDGLGAQNLEARRGHARWLTEKWRTRGIVGDSGFPSTTASALTSLTTGVHPGSTESSGTREGPRFR